MTSARTSETVHGFCTCKRPWKKSPPEIWFSRFRPSHKITQAENNGTAPGDLRRKLSAGTPFSIVSSPIADSTASHPVSTFFMWIGVGRGSVDDLCMRRCTYSHAQCQARDGPRFISTGIPRSASATNRDFVVMAGVWQNYPRPSCPMLVTR